MAAEVGLRWRSLWEEPGAQADRLRNLHRSWRSKVGEITLNPVVFNGADNPNQQITAFQAIGAGQTLLQLTSPGFSNSSSQLTHWLPFFYRPPNPLSIRHGRDVQSDQEFLSIFADTDRLDIKAFGQQYDSVYVTDDMALGWIRANPDIYTFLMDRRSQRTVGYLNAPPLNNKMYTKLRRGKANDNDISGADIVSYDKDQTLKIYLMSIVIDEDYRQLGQGPWHQAYVQLIGGFLDKLTDYAKHQSIFATHLLATAWTNEGERICKSLGMKPVGKDKFGDRIYEVELAKVTTGLQRSARGRGTPR